MPLTTGSRLGSYEITAAIGAGGMGEVYRARDPKLGRDVAIKVLPEAFARDPERMARFQREAKVLASLNHPNIATIYGLEDSGSTRALVMELVEGPTLADRIRSGAIPVDEAPRIAKQICDALEYAHERGIVHRDLKPANVKVTSDDAVKILDFGLAKALEEDAASIDISTSPTLSRLATMQGVLLGTAAYMSPEQAKGKTVDRRADIWAFGCVLYEMLTGKMAFQGEAVTDTLAAVIRAEPDWSLLPAATPPHVRVLLRRCLQKDVRQRLQAIGDARIALEEVLTGSVPAPAVAAPAWRRTLPWSVASVAVVTSLAFAFLHFGAKSIAPALPVQRFEIVAPDPSVTSVGALSPDGTRLLLGSFGGNGPSLWLRRMDSLDAHPIEGTEGAAGFPFWSPDSRWVAFASDGKLKKIDTEGGPAQVLCDVASSFVIGGFWTQDGRIVFADPTRQPGLWEVPAAGGVSSPLAGLKDAGKPGKTFPSFPVLLPDGRHFIYGIGSPVTADIYLGSLEDNSGQSFKKLLTGVAPGAVFMPSPDDSNLGYLLVVRATAVSAAGGTLLAQPVNLRELNLAGEPAQVEQGVRAGNFSASRTGTLVYGSASQVPPTGQLTLFDREGKTVRTVGEPGLYNSVALSPDGKRAVTARSNLQSGNQNLWIIDLVRGISTRFTFDTGTDLFVAWSPNGNRIAFSSDHGGSIDLYQKLSNGGSEAELLFKSDSNPIVQSWSGDGRFLLFGEGSLDAPNLFVLPLDGNAHPARKPFLFAEERIGIASRFSPGPQGHPLWIAYSSNESGRYEVYVRPFDPNSPTGTPAGGGKWQVSTEGGMSPRWNGNGKELFYVAPDGTVMSVEVSGTSVFQSGAPKVLFKPKGLAPQPNGYFNWDASSDGKEFIFSVLPSVNGAAPPARFTVILNWQAALKK